MTEETKKEKKDASEEAAEQSAEAQDESVEIQQPSEETKADEKGSGEQKEDSKEAVQESEEDIKGNTKEDLESEDTETEEVDLDAEEESAESEEKNMPLDNGPLAKGRKISIEEEDEPEPVLVVGSNAKPGSPPNLEERQVKTTVLGPMPSKEEPKKEAEDEEDLPKTKIFALRTTANREDQVMSFVHSNAARKKLNVFTVIRPHGMRGYIFLEADSRSDAEQAAFGVPYARGVLPNEIDYSEIEHMLEQVKRDVNIKKNDIAEIISGPFKREKCKITRVDKQKEEIVVELLEAAVPIPMTMKMDAVKVIRRDDVKKEE